MAKNKVVPPLGTVINSLYAEKESERGAVLIGTELVYEKVKQLLTVKIEEMNPSLFVQHKWNNIIVKTEKRTGNDKGSISFNDSTSFLGSADISIRIAWAFDFIDEYTYRNLKRVQFIRNKFAHNVEAISFKNSKNIREKLEEALKDSYSVTLGTIEPKIKLNRDTDKTHQDKFIRVIASLCLVLESEAKGQHKMSPARKIPSYQVIEIQK